MTPEPDKQVRDAARKAKLARNDLEHAIRIARTAGWSLRAIAVAAGVSHEQVRRIVTRPPASS